MSFEIQNVCRQLRDTNHKKDTLRNQNLGIALQLEKVVRSFDSAQILSRGPTSATLVQHYTNGRSLYRACWV